MKLWRFLESKYVTTNLALHEEYTPNRQALTHSCQNLINAQRTWFRWLGYVTLLTEWLLVCLHILPTPKTAKEIGMEMKAALEKKTEELKSIDKTDLKSVSLQEIIQS